MLWRVVPKVVYALFEDEAVAEAASAQLHRDPVSRTPPVVQLWTRAPLEGNELPEGATEFGRNLLIAMVTGAVFMAVVGGIAGALDLVLGMRVGMGVALGLVTGLLMGLVGAMQAGTRIAKQPLRELEPQLGRGRVLLVVEVDAAEVDRVVETIELHGPTVVDTLGNW